MQAVYRHIGDNILELFSKNLYSQYMPRAQRSQRCIRVLYIKISNVDLKLVTILATPF